MVPARRRQPTAAQRLGGRLKRARLETAVRLHGTVSQARMAELVGERLGRSLHQTAWSDYERGETEPPLDVLKAAAEVSGLPRDWLAFGDGEPKAPLEPPSEPLTDEDYERAAKRGKRQA